MVVATDGQWVSRSALAYYAAVHGIAPEAEFLDWIRARDYQPAQPSDEQRALAAAELEAIWSDRQIEGGS